MKRFLTINFAVLILSVSAFSAVAQTDAQIEKDLMAAIKEVKKYSDYGIQDDKNPLGKVADKFIGYKFNGDYFVKKN